MGLRNILKRVVVSIKNVTNGTLRRRLKWLKGKNLELVYTDKYGFNYYQYKVLTDLGFRRSMAAEVATRQAEYCLTKESLLKLISEMKEYGNKGDITNMFSLLHEIEERVQYSGEEDTLLDLAAVYFFIEGEDVDEFMSDEQEIKVARWRTDDKAKAFFLRTAFERTKNYILLCEHGIPDFSLKEVKKHHQITNIIDKPSMLITTR